jgi:large repetitive protein
MKRTLLRTLIPSLILAASFTDSRAQVAQCQNATVQLDANGNASLPDALVFSPQTDVLVPGTSNAAYNTNLVWQSFTPNVSGILERITVDMNAPSSPTGIQLRVFEGEGTGGALLHSQPVAALFNGTNTFEILATVDLTASQLYTFEITVTSGTFTPRGIQANPYPGGSSEGSNVNFALQNVDLIFSTRMLQRPSIDNGSTAPSGVVGFTLSENAFDCDDLGTVDVTLTMTDRLGNTESCVSEISVEDNIDPTASCVAGPLTVFLDAAGDGTLTIAEVDAGSADNCGFSLALSKTAFDCSDIGAAQTITLTVTDLSMNTATCNVQVDVADDVNPVALCQDVTVVLNALGQGSITAAMVNNGSNDACGIAGISVSQEDFDCSHIGDNTVTLTVEDVNGNTSTCTATVTVVDDIDPEITCPADIVLCATDNSGAQVTFPAPVGSDNCNFVITRTDGSGLFSGDVFPVGTTTIAYLITDDGGNTATCSFSVTVNARPVAGFTFTPACVAEAMFFNSTSTILPGYNIISHSYDLGDGSGPVTQVNPIYQYPVGGNYDVTLTVVSGEGCVDAITQTVTVTPGPTADFSVAPVCLGQQSAFVNESIIDPGYTGTVNYTWNFGDGSPVSTAASPTYTYATSGIFTVTLTATTDNGCTNTIQKTATVSALPQAQFSSNSVCVGNATQFNDLSFGTGLSYAWSFGDGETSTVQNPSYTYAASGSYTTTLTVTAPGGCQSSVSNAVNVIGLPTVAFDFDNACAGTSIAFTNGSSAGSYAWDFGDNNSSVLANPSKTYTTEGFYTVTLTVTSPQSCVASLSQQVEVYRNPQFTLEPTAALCFGGATGSIFVQPIPPVADFWDVSINGGAAVTNQFLFNGIAAGSYTVDVVDEFGCEGTGTVTVGQPSAPVSIAEPTITNLTCNGNGTGVLEIAANGGTAPYTYSLSEGAFQSSGLFTGLEAGDYFVQAVDANGCSESTQFYTIEEPAVLTLQLAASSNLLCNGDNSGSVNVIATGGTQPYLYNIEGGFFGESNTFTGLSAGQKTIVVRDANGCETPLNVTITQPGVLQVSVVGSTNALCNSQPNGTVQVAAASGTGPYQYSLDGSAFQGSGQFDGLAAGSYTLTARDANNCLATVSVNVTQPTQVAISTTTAPVLCFGQSTGTATITASGGTTPYTYSFNGGNSFTTQASVTSLAAGTYTLIVRDANGCEVSESATVSQPQAAISLSGNSSPVLCTGDATGSVTLSADGGTPTYAYSANGVVFQGSPTFSGLAAGTYNYFVQDINGCQAQTTVEVTAPAAPVTISQTLVSDPTCGLSTNGSVTIVANGGTPGDGYQYSVDGINFQTPSIIIGLGVGEVTVTVRDANGCVASETLLLTAPPALELTVNNAVGVECAGTFTGQIEASGDGGVGGFTFSLSGGLPQSLGTFSELTNGTYILEMADANGCTVSTEVTLPFLYPIPEPEFNWVLSGEAVFFNNTSQFADSYLWTFGDGISSTEFSPVHFYAVPGFYTATLAATNDCGTRTRTRTVNTLTIGMDDSEGTMPSLYPNPAHDLLYVVPGSGFSGEGMLEIHSIAGQRVMSVAVSTATAQGRIVLDVSGMGQGMYILTLHSASERSLARFTIVR